MRSPGAVNLNSMFAIDQGSEAKLLNYSTTKCAIMILVKALVKQMISKGIRVNGVAPGPFWTPFQVSGGDSITEFVSFGSVTPIGRTGQPAGLAPIYVRVGIARCQLYTRPDLLRHAPEICDVD